MEEDPFTRFNVLDDAPRLPRLRKAARALLNFVFVWRQRSTEELAEESKEPDVLVVPDAPYEQERPVVRIIRNGMDESAGHNGYFPEHWLDDE